jgi:hypothetical protein
MRQLSFFLLLAFLWACGPARDPHTAKVKWLLKGLARPALADSVQQEVAGFLFLTQDLPHLHAALSDSLPSASQRSLLHVLRTVHDRSTPGQIEAAYPAWPAEVQVAALNCLAEIGTEEALQTWRQLLLSSPPSGEPGFIRPVFAPLYAVPEHLSGMFPDLLALRTHPGYQAAVVEALAIGLQTGSVQPAAIRSHSQALLQSLESTLKERNRQEKGTAARQQATRLAEDLSLCLAYVPEQPAVNQWLLASLDASDPALRLMGMRACLQAEIPVPEAVIADLAEQDVTRNALFELLDQRGEAGHFPAAARQQAAFAAGDLASWLEAHGHDFSRLELLGILPLDSSAQAERVFAFRFWAKNTWRLGLSGPQPADTTRIRETGYLTGSDLTPYNRFHWEETVQDRLDSR